MADKVFPAQTVRSITSVDVTEIVLKVKPDGSTVDYFEIQYALHRLDGTTFKNGVYRRKYDDLGAGAKTRLDTILADAVALLQNKVDTATTPEEA